MAVPLMVLIMLGYESLGLQAAAGAFVALYAAGAGAAERAKVLPWVIAAIIASAALGALLSPSPWLLASGLVIMTILVSLLALAFRLGPPGSVFFVLVYGLSGSVTALVDGERLNDPLLFIGAVAIGAVFSYLVALAPLLRRVEREKPVRSLGELLPGPWLGKPEQVLLIRIIIVAVVGTLLSMLWFDSQRAYWAVSAGVAVIGLVAGRAHSVQRGLHRTIGTLLGAFLYLAIAPLGEHPWMLVLIFVCLQFLIELVIVRNYALGFVFVTPLVLLITVAATGGGDTLEIGMNRVFDTALGSVIAILTALLTPVSPFPWRKSRASKPSAP